MHARADRADHARGRRRDRGVRPRRTVHVLFGAVLPVRRHRTALGQPRPVCAAVPPAVQRRLPALAQGSDARRSRCGVGGLGRVLAQDRGTHEAPGVRRHRHQGLCRPAARAQKADRRGARHPAPRVFARRLHRRLLHREKGRQYVRHQDRRADERGQGAL